MKIHLTLLCIVLGATSSCTLGCAYQRPTPPADPNQAIIQLMQQKSLTKVVSMFEEKEKCEEKIVLKEVVKEVPVKCESPKEKTCDDLLAEYNEKCQNTFANLEF